MLHPWLFFPALAGCQIGSYTFEEMRITTLSFDGVDGELVYRSRDASDLDKLASLETEVLVGDEVVATGQGIRIDGSSVLSPIGLSYARLGPSTAWLRQQDAVPIQLVTTYVHDTLVSHFSWTVTEYGDVPAPLPPIVTVERLTVTPPSLTLHVAHDNANPITIVLDEFAVAVAGERLAVRAPEPFTLLGEEAGQWRLSLPEMPWRGQVDLDLSMVGVVETAFGPVDYDKALDSADVRVY